MHLTSQTGGIVSLYFSLVSPFPCITRVTWSMAGKRDSCWSGLAKAHWARASSLNQCKESNKPCGQHCQKFQYGTEHGRLEMNVIINKMCLECITFRMFSSRTIKVSNERWIMDSRRVIKLRMSTAVMFACDWKETEAAPPGSVMP